MAKFLKVKRPQAQDSEAVWLNVDLIETAYVVDPDSEEGEFAGPSDLPIWSLRRVDDERMTIVILDKAEDFFEVTRKSNDT